MADTVRQLMEAMIPELEDLESKGYFSRSEIKQIVKKRQDFEYALVRRATLKRDFLRYIDYETKLEELRLHRKKQLGITGRKGSAEVGITRRIHFIYERATRKFKADLSLWLAWLQYCRRAKSHTLLSKVIAKAIHRHSHVAALWAQAAAWEFDHKLNVAAARSLMQQGLRHCKRDEALWSEYVRLELMYVARLRARRAVLGLTNPESADDVEALQQGVDLRTKKGKKGKKRAREESKQQEQDGTTPVPATEGEGDASQTAPQEGAAGGQKMDTGEAAEAAGAPMDIAVKAVLTGAVVSAVIRGSFTALPNSIGLRRRLLAVLQGFSFPGIERLRGMVLSDLEARFGSHETAWDLRARSLWAPALAATLGGPEADSPAAPGTSSDDALIESLMAQPRGGPETGGGGADASSSGQEGTPADLSTVADPSSLAAVCAVYEAGLNAVPTPRMHALYAGFLSQQLWPLLAAAESGDVAAVEQVASTGAQLLALFKRAHSSASTSSPALGVHWVDWALRLGQPKAAVKAARTACTLWPSNAQTWGRRLRLELDMLNAKQQPADELFSTLEAALKAVPLNAGGTALWDLALDTITPGHAQHPRLVSMFLTSLAAGSRGPLTGGAGAVAARLLRSVHESQGLEGARKLVSRISAGPAPGGDFYHAAIEIEEAALKSNTSTIASSSSSVASKGAGDEKRVRALYEAAAELYGSEDTQLWLSYALFEQSCKRSAGRIYWRGTKALSDPQPFIDQFRAVLGSSAEGATQT